MYLPKVGSSPSSPQTSTMSNLNADVASQIRALPDGTNANIGTTIIVNDWSTQQGQGRDQYLVEIGAGSWALLDRAAFLDGSILIDGVLEDATVAPNGGYIAQSGVSADEMSPTALSALETHIIDTLNGTKDGIFLPPLE